MNTNKSTDRRVCQSCWVGAAYRRIKSADGKKRWKCERCIEMVAQAKARLRK